jgi:hypothetical protein
VGGDALEVVRARAEVCGGVSVNGGDLVTGLGGDVVAAVGASDAKFRAGLVHNCRSWSKSAMTPLLFAQKSSPCVAVSRRIQQQAWLKMDTNERTHTDDAGTGIGTEGLALVAVKSGVGGSGTLEARTRWCSLCLLQMTFKIRILRVSSSGTYDTETLMTC